MQAAKDADGAKKARQSTPEETERADESDVHGELGFAVRDRRFWALDTEEEGASKDERPPRAERPAYVEGLEQRLAEQEQRLLEYIDAHKASERQFAEARERLRRERDREIEREKAALVGRFFEVLDNMDRSLDAAEQGAADDRMSFEALRDGVRLVRQQLLDVLAGMGLERIDPVGEPFDPSIHDAMSLVPVDDAAEDNVVQQLFRCGYRQGEQILRPAMVLVGRFTSDHSHSATTPAAEE